MTAAGLRGLSVCVSIPVCWRSVKLSNTQHSTPATQIHSSHLSCYHPSYGTDPIFASTSRKTDRVFFASVEPDHNLYRTSHTGGTITTKASSDIHRRHKLFHLSWYGLGPSFYSVGHRLMVPCGDCSKRCTNWMCVNYLSYYSTI